jgi:hypothetical protein
MIEITHINFGRTIMIPQLSNNPQPWLYVGLGGNAGQVTISAMTLDERARLLYVEAKGLTGDPAAFTWHQPVDSSIGKALAKSSKKVVCIAIPDGSAWYCDVVPGREGKPGK